MGSVHKGQILPIVNQMIPIDKETTFHASYDHHLNGFNQGEIVEPLGPTRSTTFNGSNTQIDVGTNSIYDLTNYGEISAWVKPNRDYPGDTTATSFRQIVNKAYSGGTAGISYVLDWNGSNTSRTLRGAIYNGASTNDLLITHDFGQKWTHVLFRWDGAFLRIFIDGIEKASRAQTLNAQVLSNAPLKIGNGFGGSYYWSGEIADVKISNQGGLIAHWPLTESEGLIVYDVSAYGNECMITGTLSRSNNGPTTAILKKEEGKFRGAVLIEPETENLLTEVSNVDFWNGAGKTNISWGYTNEYIPGENALLVKSNSSSHNGHSFLLPIISGQEYTLQAEIKAITNTNYGTILAALFDNTNTCIKTNYLLPVTRDSGWRNYSANKYGYVHATFSMPSDVLTIYPTATHWTLQIIGSGSVQSEIYYKNLQLETRDTPTSLVYGNRPLGKLWYPKELINPSAFTISCWYNTPYMHRSVIGNAGIAGNYWTPIVEFAPTTNLGDVTGICLVAGINTDRKIRLRSPINTAGTTSIQDGTWNHTVLTYDGTTYKVFLNGNLEITVASTPSVPTEDWRLMVGGGYQGKPNIMIDELRIESRQISDEEVAAWAASGLHYNYLDYSHYVD